LTKLAPSEITHVKTESSLEGTQDFERAAVEEKCVSASA